MKKKFAHDLENRTRMIADERRSKKDPEWKKTFSPPINTSFPSLKMICPYTHTDTGFHSCQGSAKAIIQPDTS
jgi:hypothetical protein